MRKFFVVGLVAVMLLVFVPMAHAQMSFGERISVATSFGIGVPTGDAPELNTALVKNTYFLFSLDGLLGEGWKVGLHYGGSDYKADAIDELDTEQYGGFLVFSEDSAFGRGIGFLAKFELMTSTFDGDESYTFGPLAGVGTYKQVGKHWHIFAGIDWMKIPLPDKVVVVKEVETLIEQEDVTQFGFHFGLEFTPKVK